MADKDTPIYDKTRMRGTTWVDATRILFNMGSEGAFFFGGIGATCIAVNMSMAPGIGFS